MTPRRRLRGTRLETDERQRLSPARRRVTRRLFTYEEYTAAKRREAIVRTPGFHPSVVAAVSTLQASGPGRADVAKREEVAS